MHYQWYPGHMTKAMRQMQKDLRLIDLLIELVDARIPSSSRNPGMDDLGKHKARLLILNKADLADEQYNRLWTDVFRAQGYYVLEANAKNAQVSKAVLAKIRESCREKIERDRKKGIIGRPIRAMVVGIPNVGKSTFINTLAGRASTKTGDKPGITKGKQWISIKKDVELLDTPGVLWPKFEDQTVGLRLAMIGSINENIIDITELSHKIIEFMAKSYPGTLEAHYQIGTFADTSEALYMICEQRRCFLKGAEPDIVRAARMLTLDFRAGKLGRVTLDRVIARR